MTSQRKNKNNRSSSFKMGSKPDAIVSTPVQLSSRGCLSLAQIIDAFQTPITEEFAWALCYQLAKCGQQTLTTTDSTRKRCLLLTSSAQLLVHKDGMVHEDTFLNTNLEHAENEADVNPGEARMRCCQERKLISNMAVVIFLALDYGLSGDLERIISPDLETILDAMLAADVYARTDFAKDESSRNERHNGDHQDSNCDFNRIIKVCTQRMRKSCRRNRVDACYKAICRNYVTEALELYTFLAKVTKCSVDPDLRLLNSSFEPARKGSKNVNLVNMGFIEWARHWTEVIRDLRQGVKLKKVFCRHQPYAPELTPYEILMEDIRCRRYKLKKVVNATVMEKSRPPIAIGENDHHRALILELTQSSPARLRKATDRILNPPPAIEPTPVEKLMTSIIRQEHQLAHIKLPKVNFTEEEE